MCERSLNVKAGRSPHLGALSLLDAEEYLTSRKRTETVKKAS